MNVGVASAKNCGRGCLARGAQEDRHPPKLKLGLGGGQHFAPHEPGCVARIPDNERQICPNDSPEIFSHGTVILPQVPKIFPPWPCS